MISTRSRERSNHSLFTRFLVLAVAVVVVCSGVTPFVVAPFVGVAAAATETEPNDTLETATPIPLGETVTATLTGNDDDYFSFSAGADQRVRIDAQMTDRESFQLSAIQVLSFDTEGRLVNTAGITLAPATTGFLTGEAGTYYVAVQNNFNLDASYEFTVTTEPVADAFEPNDEIGAATPVDLGGSYDAFAYYGDTDYYVYQATAGEQVTFELANREANGFRNFGLNRDCALVADCATLAEDTFGSGLVSPSAQAGTTTSLTVNATTDGAIYVSVGSISQPDPTGDYDGNPYTLSVPDPAAPGAGLIDLGYIPAGGPGNATTGTVGAGETQQFSFTALGNFPAVVTLDATDGTALDVRVLRGETVLDAGNTSAGPRTLTVDTGPVAGFVRTNTLVVEVDGAAEGGPFSLAVAVPNDRFEPNDDRASATPITAGTVPTAPSPAAIPLDFAITPGDADWFVLDLDEPSSVGVVLASLHADNAGGSVQVTIFDESQAVLAAENTQDTQLIAETEPTTGTVYVRVNGAGGAYGGYGLLVVATPEPLPANDLYDAIAANDDPVSATDIGVVTPGGTVGLPDYSATPFPTPITLPEGFVFGEATVDPADDDWFAVEVPTGSFPVIVTVTPVSGQGSYDLIVLRGDGAIADSVSAAGEASVSFTTDQFQPGQSTAPETVRIGVTGASDVRTYTLSVAIPDDGFEENDDLTSAATIPVTEIDAGAAGPFPPGAQAILAVAVDGDPDWYTFTPPADRPLTYLFDAFGAGPVDVALFDSTGTELSLGDDGTVRTDGSPYYLRVIGGNSEPFQYSLVAVYGDETVPAEPNDLYDAIATNDDPASATDIDVVAPGQTIGLPDYSGIPFPAPVTLPDGVVAGQATVDPADDDWFAVEVPTGSFPVAVAVTPVSGQGSYELIVLRGDGGIADSVATAGGASISLTTDSFESGQSASPEVIRIGVRDATDERTYTLTVAVPDDGYEENDDRASAKTIPITEVDAGTIGPTPGAVSGILAVAVDGDPDWYTVTAPAGRPLAYQFETLGTGTVDVTLFDSTGAQVSLGGDGTVRADGDAYSLRVTTSSATPVQYTLAAFYGDETVPLPPNDLYEVNDVQASAIAIGTASLTTPVSLPDPTGLPVVPFPVGELPDGVVPGVAVAGGGDTDWYRIDAVGGDEVVVTLGYDAAVGSLSVALFDATGAQVASGTTTTAGAQAVAASAAPVFVRVTGGETPVQYTLDATVRLALPTGGDTTAGSSGGSGGPTLPAATFGATGDLQGGTAGFQFNGGTGVLGVNLTLPGAEGVVSVQELSELPDGVPTPQGQLLRVFEIDAPAPSNGTATVGLTVSRTLVAAFGTSPDDLVVQHYVDGAWEVLPTTVTQEGSTYVVTAETTGFSPFALTELVETTGDDAAGGETTADVADDDTTGDADGDDTREESTPSTGESSTEDSAVTPSSETPTTETTTPGFGVLVALLALLAVLAVAVVVSRRR